MTDTYRQSHLSLLSALAVTALLFLLSTHLRTPSANGANGVTSNTIVIAAPLQAIMYAGDRFLAANIENIRVAAIGPTDESSLAEYRLRAHSLISQLNPCHEDNFYLANAMLSWGGEVEAGNEILQEATKCRYWDEIPPFFLGFNRYFFNNDLAGAQQAIEIAAERTTENRAAMQKMAIMIAARKLNDEKMAIAYLIQQREETSDPKLKEMLSRRLGRLEGLIELRNAQARFEDIHDRELKHPNELLSSGVLEKFPQDPLRIGYEFYNGKFRLRAMNVGGMEIR